MAFNKRLPPPHPPSKGLVIGGLATGISACVVSVAALILSIIALVKANRILSSSSSPTTEDPPPSSVFPPSTPVLYHIPSSPSLLYQFLGHAWDHETSDFKVLYVPLYSVKSKDSCYESHTVAVTHFKRWDEKFVPYKGTVTEEQR